MDIIFQSCIVIIIDFKQIVALKNRGLQVQVIL